MQQASQRGASSAESERDALESPHLSAPSHPLASPLPSSESNGLACGFWVTRSVSHLRARCHPGTPSTPMGTGTSGLGGASSPSATHQVAGKVSDQVHAWHRNQAPAFGAWLGAECGQPAASTRTMPIATCGANPAPAVSLTQQSVHKAHFQTLAW